MNRKELLKIFNLSRFTAFDFETTGLDPYNDRIIEIAAIRFVDGEITERFVHLINPERPISGMITEITGISNKMVRNAPTEETIIDDFLYFLGDDPLVAHNIHFDVQFLAQLCSRLGRDDKEHVKYDTLQLSRSILFEQPVFNLGALSEYFGLSSKGSHRAEKDTENTGLIFLEMLDELAAYPLELISKVIALTKGTGIPNQKLFVDLGNELTRRGDLKSGLMQSKFEHDFKWNTFRCDGTRDIRQISADDVFGPVGLLKNVHPNFESRPNQAKYASLAEEMLTIEKGAGVVEAGTGMGKTMAYLFGAFKNSVNVEDEGPTLVACHTKHLQDQLFYKDLPQLAETLDVPIKAVMMKGRTNYICKTRFNWLISDSRTLDGLDVEALIPLLFWMQWTKTGDLSECSGFFNSRRTWLKSAFSSEPGFCTGEICKNHDGCYYGKLKKAIFNAQIIVVNHSLLMTDASQPGFLPNYNSVIVDEAHNLVKSAYDQFKTEWSEQSVSYLLQTVDPSFPRSARWNNILHKIGEIEPGITNLRDDLKDAVKKAQKCLKSFMLALSEDNHNRFTPAKAYQDKPILGRLEKVYAPLTLELYDMKQNLENVFSILDKIRKAVLEMDPSRTDFPVLHSVLDRGLETSSGLMTSLVRLTENQDSDWVYWMEGEYRNPHTAKEKLILSLHASLVDVAETLNGKFFKRFDHCFLTSATLKVNNSFDYFLRRVGLDDFDSVITKEFLSPFLYNEQVTYHQYGGAREISNDPTMIGDLVHHLHKTIGKRIMVLFTSRKALTDTANYLKDKPGGRDLPLFAQIRGASRPGIIKAMHQHPNGILFGTNSFWEGVDLPGDLLEILILVKLPFDVPSEPLVKSYSEFISRQGGNSFMEYSLPETAIRFRQGFGRLIRTTYDSGKFICLDNRIVTKRYGSIFARSLPVEMTPFSEMDSIR
ncbi:MAG: hypothetical protein HOE56_02560 [Candidatus Marinimicrobia bacterium]|nr:hypothetical protein [Candidatus Neomarinimicrobiota bacterium]